LIFSGNQPQFYTGTAAIAVKTNTPIIIILCRNKKKLDILEYVEELKFDDLVDSDENKELIITQRYMNILEKYIQLYPEQWFWMHNIGV